MSRRRLSACKIQTDRPISPSGGGGSGDRAPTIRAYRSIVTDVFDGRLLSSVECLTCGYISRTKENFQDLSLPIPTADQLERLNAAPSQSQEAIKGDDDGMRNTGTIC